MQDLREMYAELYAAINSMPLPSSPDDPEPQEPEEYVEPEWVAQMDEVEWLAPEFGSRKRQWFDAFNAQMFFIRKCGGSIEVPEELRDFEF